MVRFALIFTLCCAPQHTYWSVLYGTTIRDDCRIIGLKAYLESVSKGKSNEPKGSQGNRIGTFALVAVLGAARQARAQDAKTPYPSMAPLDQYLIADRNAEIALARTAAPPSISRDAKVMVLGAARL